MADIAIIDYGMGNLRSVQQALRSVAPDASIVVTSDPAEVKLATRVVFPGQGAMPDCMRELDARGLRAAVLEAAGNKPFLGICIGLQMLFEHSAEGDITGLGILKGSVVRFAGNLRDEQGNKLKVPHMGWNQVQHKSIPVSVARNETAGHSAQLQQPTVASQPVLAGEEKMSAATPGASTGIEAHPLWNGIEQDARFYFVHSYYVQPQDQALVQATSSYPQPFVCAMARDNLFAVQFHPEKSQSAGLTLLRNFASWNPA
jgi:glutamine amidotransferase